MHNSTEPLTTEEANFAAERHNLIIHFLSSRHLPEDDFYDVVAIGFVRAVKKWFSRSDLHKYAFSTIAWDCMRTNVGDYQRSDKRHNNLSLDYPLSGTGNMIFADVIPDPSPSLDDMICIRETLSEALGKTRLEA